MAKNNKARQAKQSKLQDELISPVVGGANQFIAYFAGLSPNQIKAVLNDARESPAPDDFFALAHKMERQESHIGAVVGVRQRALFGLEAKVEISQKPSKPEEALRQWIKSPVFLDLLDGLLDSLLCGLSVVELLWSVQGGLWLPRKAIWRDARFFEWDFQSSQLKIKALYAGEESEELPPYKFAVCRLDHRQSSPATGGVAYTIAPLFGVKSYIMARWAEFVENYGTPLRLGKYNNSASKEEKEVLKKATRSLGRDAAAIVPEGMMIEFIEVKNQEGNVFENLLNWINREISKAVLGQTMTTEDGSSLAQAQVHNDVREDILHSDARSLERAINRDVIEAIWSLNQLAGTAPPVRFHIPDDVNEATLVENVTKLHAMGVEVDHAWLRNKLGIPEPTGKQLKNQAELQSSTHAEDATGEDELDKLVDSMMEFKDYMDEWEEVTSIEQAKTIDPYPSEKQSENLAQGLIAAQTLGFNDAI